MKKILDILNENKSYLSDNWFSDISKYDLRRSNDILIFVDVDKLLKKHSEDQPNFDIIKKENQIGNRLEKDKEFIKNYKNDDRFINPKTGERTNYKVRFEPSVVSINDSKLSFEDGRHRVLAAKEMGLKKVAIEIQKNQIELFKEWLDDSNENINENMEKGNTIYRDNNIGVTIKDLKNKLVRLSDLDQESNSDKKMSPIYPNMTEKDADSIYFEIQNYIKEYPNEEGLKKVKDEFESGSNKAAGLKYWYKKIYDVFNTRESLKHLKSYKNY